MYLNPNGTTDRKSWILSMPDQLRLLVHLTVQEDTTWPREYAKTVQVAYEEWTDMPTFVRQQQGDLLEQHEEWCVKIREAEKAVLKAERSAFMSLSPCFGIC